MLKYFILSYFCISLAYTRSVKLNLPGNRIVGGVEVDITERPFQVALLYDGFQFCGGAIINENTILTAAHCLDEQSVSHYSIRAGSASQYEGGVVIPVSQVINNPDYDENTSDGDVAIMKLASPLTFGDTIQPVPLADKTLFVPDGAPVIVSGWGDLESGAGEYPENLRQVEVPVVNQRTCDIAYGGITERMICAGIESKDSCQGDSGGPLTYNGVHIGVVSFGIGCAFDGYPGVYARTSALRDFIDKYA